MITPHPLHQLHNAGCKLIPISPGEKRPAILEWPKFVATPADIDRWIAGAFGVGVLSASNPVIDIDVTDPRLNRAIRQTLGNLIPSPLYRIGNPPKTAVICATPAPFPKIRISLLHSNGAPILNANGKPAVVEILGDGQQAIISGVHPGTGKPYYYERGNERGGVELLAAQATAGALPIISATWVKEALLPALARSLRGVRLDLDASRKSEERKLVAQESLRAPSIEVLRECVSRIPNDSASRDDYIRLLYAIKAAAGENTGQGREIALEWAYRWTDGVNAPGVVEREWESLRAPFEIGFDFLAALARPHGFNDAELDFTALTDKPAEKNSKPRPLSAVERFNTDYAVVWSVASGILHTPDNGQPKIMPIAHWRVMTQNQFTIGDDGKRIRTNEQWLASPERRAFGRLLFEPSLPPLSAVPSAHGTEDFNLYTGLAVQPSVEGSCALFLTHLRDVVANGNEEAYQWVLMWLASIVQQPEKLPGTALVLRGAQGAGKSFVGEVFERVLGEMHVTIADPGALTARFNSLHERKLLIQVEEAFFAGDPRNVGKLKNMITAPKVTIERKGVEPYEIGNYARLLITSNESWVVPAGLGERRFMVLDVSDNYANDGEYHGALRSQMFDKGGCARLLDYLQREVAIDQKLIARPLATEALRDQQIASLNGEHRWFLDILLDGALPGDESGEGIAPKDTLWQHYEGALRQRGERRSSKEALGKFVKQFGVTTSRPRSGLDRLQTYVFPPLTDCRARFGRDLAAPPDWPEQSAWAGNSALGVLS